MEGTIDDAGNDGRNEDGSLREISDRLRDDLNELRDVLRRKRDALLSEATRQIADHPVAAVAIAFGAGYLLSGALLSRTTVRLMRIGARIALAQLARGGAWGALQNLIASAEPPVDETAKTSAGRNPRGTEEPWH